MTKKSKYGIHITHNDSDAVGCALIASLYFNEYNLNLHTYFCNATGASDQIKDIINNINNSDYIEMPELILISDISISDEVAYILNNLIKYYGVTVIGFDHHESNHLDEKYNWFHIIRENQYDWIICDYTPVSACYYMYSYLKQDTNNEFIKFKNKTNTKLFKNHKLFEVINGISRYDTWIWKKFEYKHDNPDDDIIQICCRFLSPETCFKELYELYNSKCHGYKYPPFFIDIYNSRKYSESRAVNSVYDKTRCINMYGYDIVAFISNDDFSNSCCEYLYNLSDDIDIVCCFYPASNSISLRSKKDNINLSEIASKLGGGGHKSAAGVKFSDEEYIKLLNIFYKETEPLNLYIDKDGSTI